jgi:hypothetical protein
MSGNGPKSFFSFHCFGTGPGVMLAPFRFPCRCMPVFVIAALFLTEPLGFLADCYYICTNARQRAVKWLLNESKGRGPA